MAAKKTFTYATEPGIKEKASKKAKREKLTLSEKIDQMLKEYVKPIKRCAITDPTTREAMGLD